MHLRLLSRRREPLTIQDDGSTRQFMRGERLLQGPKATEMKPALLIMVFVASASPGLAADKRDLGQDRLE